VRCVLDPILADDEREAMGREFDAEDGRLAGVIGCAVDAIVVAENSGRRRGRDALERGGFLQRVDRVTEQAGRTRRLTGAAVLERRHVRLRLRAAFEGFVQGRTPTPYARWFPRIGTGFQAVTRRNRGMSATVWLGKPTREGPGCSRCLDFRRGNDRV